MIAMLLAGGQGSRLGVLTSKLAKPAVAFGGKYKIIDFPLSNCINSGIDTVGVLTQYQPLRLNQHIGIGIPWDLDRNVGGVSILPPYEKSTNSEWYTGTANAIYQNLEYMESYNPDYVLILSGDHIYKMDYAAMLTRYCIDGGLEPEQAYRLSDFYILKMDTCTTVRQIADLHHEMAKDFTGKMVLQKKSSILSKPVVQCVDYIYSHIKERITVAVLAEYTGLSESYLSRIFKQNLGISISDYIREKKIEKATHLLRYSDKSIIDIANYLSFSSQSHFIQTFENFTGMTPKKYRNKYYKSMW